MHLIFITSDRKDATIAQKQSYQGKKKIWKTIILLDFENFTWYWNG